MSTNINHQGLPNINDLQNLANELFKALPNEFPKEISLSPDHKEHPRATKIAETLLHTANIGNLDPIPTEAPLHVQPTPNSFSGFGATPSVQNYNTSGVSALYPNAGAGFDPQNGNSRSGIQEDPNLNFNNPQTGFSDINLNNSSKPQFGEESFFSQLLLNNQYLPFQTENSSFEIELKTALETVDTQFRKRIDFPSSGSEIANSYYFLDQNPFAFDKKDTNIIVGNSFDTKEINGFTGNNFNASLIKKDFPILSETVNGKPLIWFDNAATTQKPKSVIDRIAYFYEHENSNIHRAAHELAARASDAYEAAREKVKVFLNAGSVNEIVFVRGATEGINLVAQSWGDHNLVAGDEIIVSNLEHHANIVP